MRERTARTTEVGTWHAAPAASPQRIRWGAVFAGTVLGLSLLALLTTLWFALAHASEVENVRANLEWYVGISAIGCLFVGGVLAGWLSGVRGALTGAFNGMAIWSMILLLTLAVGLPSIFNVLNLGRVTQIDTAATDLGVNTALWATFWSILGGLLASAVGGAIGGAVTRPANAELAVPATAHVEDRPDVVRDRTDVIHDRDEDDVEVHRSRAS